MNAGKSSCFEQTGLIKCEDGLECLVRPRYVRTCLFIQKPPVASPLPRCRNRPGRDRHHCRAVRWKYRASPAAALLPIFAAKLPCRTGRTPSVRPACLLQNLEVGKSLPCPQGWGKWSVREHGIPRTGLHQMHYCHRA